MLGGGFLEKDAVMIAGSAGTGKTTFALQYLVNGAYQSDDSGIYLTFEQMPDQIYRDAMNFGWDLQKMEKENKFRLIMSSPDLMLEERGAEALLQRAISEIRPRRIVIDSLSHLAMYVKEDQLRKEIYRLVMYLKTQGLSSLHIWESPQIMGQTFSVTDVGLSFLVDGIVILRFVEIDSSMRRALVIMKMRGTNHDQRLKEYIITENGLKIKLPFEKYQGLMTGSPTRAASEKFLDLLSQAGKGK
jgi:circadian clock protein KaiC